MFIKFMIITGIFIISVIMICLGKMLLDELIEFINDEKDKFSRIKYQFNNTDKNK